MASLAHDRDSGQAGQGRANRAPLSAHPAFPFIVGLWFAALLGIGSLVVPVPVIERLVDMTGLASIVPQTAPPLGFTARALIALACTAGGGLAGLLVARRLGQAQRAPAGHKDRGKATARRPISAHDELGSEGFDGNASRGRRALAIVEEEGPSEVFDLAPLPGKALPLSALDLAEVEALELAEAEVVEPAAELPDAPVVDAPEADLALPDFAMADRQHFKLDTFGQTVGAPIQPHQQFILDPAAAEEDFATLPRVDQPEAEDLPEADLHFSPPSLAQPFAPTDFEPDHTEEAEMDDFAEPAGLEPVPAAPHPAAPAADWQDGEVEDLALVQLAQRLGSSIARRREQRAAAAMAAASAAPTPVPAPMPSPAKLAEEFDAAEAAEAAQAMAAYFGSAPAPAVSAEEPEPAADQADPVVTPLALPAERQLFRPVEPIPAPQPAPLANLAHIDLGEDDEDEDDDHISLLAASFSLPLISQVPAPVVGQEDEAFDEEMPDEEMIVAPAPAPFANPFQQRAPQFVRIENEPQPEVGGIEPAVVFPGEARAETGAAAPRVSSEENERALREALLGLQRMSGAA